MKFVMSEMTMLKFFLPLIVEGNKRNMRSTIFVGRSNKYNCPYQHKEALVKLSKAYNFQLLEMSESNDAEHDVLFTVEGVNRHDIKNKKKIISLYCSSDFTVSYQNYINDVDHVVLGSRYVADRYDKKSSKVICLGTPKFDVDIDKNDVIRRYSLTPGKRRVVVFYPRARDLRSSRLDDIVATFKERDYEIVFKTRGKDPYQSTHNSLTPYRFYDESWFPSTAMQLITVSDVVVNFSSTVIEETTVLKKPMLNYHIKPFDQTFDFLYRFDFVENLKRNFDVFDLHEKVQKLETTKFQDFDKAIDTLLDTKESSKQIIDHLL
jgi:hypothetical protein